MSKSGIARHSTRVDMRYHKGDRARNKILVGMWEYGKLPSKESMRKAIWRGQNCHGDNTSFGEYNSGTYDERILEKILDKHIGKSFDEYYSKMCKKFKGIDRYRFEQFLFWRFETCFIFGREYTDYVVIDGLIVKN